MLQHDWIKLFCPNFMNYLKKVFQAGFKLRTILELYICIQIQIIQLLLFTEKFLPLQGFEPGRDLPGTKPICYQFSYPGLDPTEIFILFFVAAFLQVFIQHFLFLFLFLSYFLFIFLSSFLFSDY